MPSRRHLIAMSADEIRTYLRVRHRLILVSNGHKGYPHPMPMNFVLDEQDRFLMTTFRKSQKVLNLQRDPKATLLVESGMAYQDLKSVLAYARAEIIDDADEVIKVMSRLFARDPGIAGDNAATLLKQSEAMASKRVVLRFSADAYLSWDHGKLGGRY